MNTGDMNTEETTRQVKQAQAGDLAAFNWIVKQFQDMAVGYAASVLGDLPSAQDAAQEAFVEAYFSLSSLRSPEAFPAWLRKIVFKHCDRQTRRHQVATLPMEAAESLASPVPGLEDMVEEQESQEAVRWAVQSLPRDQREVITLFYAAQHSQQDISAFLGLPVTTIKSRLHQGRSQLRSILQESRKPMTSENFQTSYPPRDEAFAARVNQDIAVALTALAAETEDTPPVSYDLSRPVNHLMGGLMGSLLLWAIEVEASELRLLPEAEQIRVQLKIGDSLQTVMALPKPLQDALAQRFKAAGEMEIARSATPQEGLIPILHDKVEYEAVITVISSKQGERVTIALSRLGK